jgi:ribosomal protein S18 acetylase RimI-like enzyme
MMHACVEWFRKKEISRISVVTQGRNVLANRFYQKHGFILRSAECWYHKWFTENAAATLH